MVNKKLDTVQAAFIVWIYRNKRDDLTEKYKEMVANAYCVKSYREKDAHRFNKLRNIYSSDYSIVLKNNKTT